MLLASVACAGSNASSPGAQSPEIQSDAQVQVAADYFRRAQFRQALEHTRQAIELNDENKEAYFMAATIHMVFCSGQEGARSPDCNLAQAEKYARKALEIDEKYREARNSLAAVLIEERRYDEAIKTLEPLVNDPAYDSVHLAWGNLGWAQVQAGRVDQGIESLKKSIALMPAFCVGMYRLGIAYEKKRDFSQAEAAFTRAVTSDHDECKRLQDAWFSRARVRMNLGKREDSRADFTKCRDLSTESETGRACAASLASLPPPAPLPNTPDSQ